ncbi:glycoside hydrolase family 97 catalytic domain-containing protein [Paenibacillus hodogayensis]|uniref:Glycoside hydrolase family 97 catalytic domain-containing protein n=1 Tax=Paenibacillus hodogayensis TaxID=279208 RepID=A0ABV5VPX8_9BACL
MKLESLTWTGTVKLESPGSRLTATIGVDETGRLRYAVERAGRKVIEPSEMGIIVDGTDLGEGVRIGTTSRVAIDETYRTRGRHAMAINRCADLTVEIKHESSEQRCVVHARAYDDGFAYRYIVPGDGSRTVGGERSSWTIPTDSKVWFFERNSGWKLKSYAGEWIHTSPEHLSIVSSQGPVQGTPLVLEFPGPYGYAALMEAALYDYSGMRLEAVGNRTVRANFTEGADGFRVQGRIVTPWRVTMVASDLNGLVNSDLIENLNPPPLPGLFADPSYIKPGRSVWRWWSQGTGTPSEEREYVDYAVRLGFEYTTVDEGWELWPDTWNELRELTCYAASRDIGVFVWKRSKEIDDPADGYKQMRDFFDAVREAGVTGLKIDFIDNETKVAIDFETNALRLAAERKLMINFHGISKPTGESRTYPNEITREGIRGLELNKMKEGPIPAFHNAALPFTRFVAGHGDYTPVGYSNPGPTTFAHQLATAIVFTSPLQVIADNPAVLLEDERVIPALDVLKAIPPVWDETVVLAPSAIAELAVFARRIGACWFVGALNGTEETRTIDSLELSFLGSGPYEAVLLSSPEPKAFERIERILGSVERSLAVTMGPADGFVAMFAPSADKE